MDLLHVFGLCGVIADVRLRVVKHHVSVLLFCAQLAPCPVLLGALTLALRRGLVAGGMGRRTTSRLLPISPRHLCAGWSCLGCENVARWRWGCRSRGVWGLYWGRVVARVEECALRRFLQSFYGRTLLRAVVVDAGLWGSDLDARCARVTLAFELLHLPVKVGAELVAVDDAAELRLELCAVQADKEGAHIVEQLVDPCQVDKTLVDGDEDEAQVFCVRPLEGVALLLVRWLGPAVVGLW